MCAQLEEDITRPATGLFGHLLRAQPPAPHRACIADCLDTARLKATWTIAQQARVRCPPLHLTHCTARHRVAGLARSWKVTGAQRVLKG